MPRDGSNVYHIPPGTEGVPDTVIESAKYNTYIADIEQDLNAPRPILAGGTGAINADAALAALGAEKASQIVTNYNSHVFVTGSFSSASSATGSPVSGHAFAGIVYVVDSNNLIIEARDRDDTVVPPRIYVRQKKAGVWGAWAADFDQAAQNTLNDGRYVNTTGDTMSGNLTLTAPAKILGTAKGHHFGSATGTLATGSVTQADANVILYNNGTNNWAGVGSDTSGNMWFRVGVTGTPPPQMYLSSSTGFLTVALGVQVPTPAVGANSTEVPNTAWVRTHVDSAVIPSGTVMVFYQAAAPTGWTKLVTQNDKALRVVSGTGGVAGGTNAFSTVMAQTVVGGTAISTAQMPAHTHGIYNDSTFAASTTVASGGGATRMEVNNTLGTASGSAGSGSTHNHTITMGIQYIDVILASRN